MKKIISILLCFSLILSVTIPINVNATTLAEVTTVEETNFIQKMLDKLEQIIGLMAKTGSITVKCTDENDNIIYQKTDVDLKFGSYKYTYPEISGYDLISEPQKQVTISKTKRNAIVEFKYETIKSEENIDLNENKNITEIQEGAVEVDLAKFNIYNDNTHPIETTNGLTEAFKYYSENNIEKIYLPKGTYSIDSDISLVLTEEMSNLDIDLHGSTIMIAVNDKINANMINFDKACNNVRIHNGTLKGDRQDHDYKTNSGTHEWNTNVVLNECNGITLENLYIVDSPGFCLSSSKGANSLGGSTYVSKFNLEIGNIDDSGNKVDSSDVIRTINPIDMSKCTRNLYEIGYHLGYSGYRFMQAKEYDAYYYDENMNLIGSAKNQLQFIKYEMPEGTKKAHFVFHQNHIPYGGDTDFGSATVFVTDFRGPEDIVIRDCTFDRNRALSAALCGGQGWLIENNRFLHSEKIATTSPNYFVDIEDAWEYENNITFRNNYFDENRNNLVVCAGQNLKFENNEFNSTVYFWPRIQSYTFTNNVVKKSANNTSTPMCNFGYRDDKTVIKDNTIINRSIGVEKYNSSTPAINIDNFTLIDSSVNAIPSDSFVTNSTFKTNKESGTSNVKLSGSFKNCVFDRVGGFSDCKVYDSTIKNVSTTNYGKYCEFYNNSFENYGFYTGQTTKILYKDNIMNNFSGSVSTWGGQTEMSFINNTVNNNDNFKSNFLSLSLGKSKNILLKDNTFNVNLDVINIYDVGYSTPDANITAETNTVESLPEGKYFIKGAKPTSGKTVVNLKDNTGVITEENEIHSNYINNDFVELTRTGTN